MPPTGGERPNLRAAQAAAAAWAEYDAGRINAELEFARWLAARHPGRAKTWRRLIERAERIVESALTGGGTGGLKRAVREAEAVLGPLRGEAKRFTVHLVGHGHIDMNWVWSWPETVAIVNDTFTTVLKLMEEFPRFTYSQSQASVYRIVERFNPDLLARIARRVQEGRWEVTASHWVEGDKNMAGGEAQVRQILQAKRAMGRMFGLAPDDLRVDWSPDTFGHAATVPTYLSHGGISYLYLHRPGFLGPQRHNAFWWKGPDGSRVLVYNDMKLGYNGVVTPDLGRFAAEFHEGSGSRDLIFVYGVGDHGGGPTRMDLERAVDLATWPIFPDVRFSTAHGFFRKLESQAARLPVVTGELNTEFSGCYTTQTLIKKGNRYSENRLADAEVAAALLGDVTRTGYPRAAFNEAWERTLFSHFHDILPGSGIHDTRTYAHASYQEVIATATMVETRALRALADLVDTRGSAGAPGPVALPFPPGAGPASLGSGAGMWSRDGRLSTAELSGDGLTRPFLVWNPTQWEREEVVEAVLWFSRKPDHTSFSVRTPEGKSLPAQTIRAGNEWWSHEFVVVAFPVRVPAFGYAVYTVFAGPAPDRPAGDPVRLLEPRHGTAYSTVERPPYGLDNGLVRLVLDPVTGGIASLRDLKADRELIGPAPAGLLFGIERHHGMSSWTVGHTGPWEPLTVVSMGGKEDGPERASVAVELARGESRFTVTYRLQRGSPSLAIDLEGTWLETGNPAKGVPVLKLAVPLALKGSSARYEIPFGSLVRPQVSNEEVPALEWACVTGRDGRGRAAGLILANDCKHGHALDGSTLNLTLIRSSYDPDPFPELGRHEAHLNLTPCAGDAAPSAVTRVARRLNHPLRVVGTGVHAGPLPGRATALGVSGRGVVVTGVKRAEDSGDLIVRLVEADGRATEATVGPAPTIAGTPRGAGSCDALERSGADARVRVTRGGAAVRLPARGLAAVRLKLASR